MATEDIASQTETTYEQYKKIKSIVDLGYFLENYIVIGGVVTKDVTYNNIVNVTEIVVSLDDDVTRREATSFKTKVANTTYYLDYMSSGDFSWDTAHYNGSYLPVAQVTTDANKNVLSITDMRGTIGGVRFKYDVSYNGNSLSQLSGIIADITQLQGADKTKTATMYNQALSEINVAPNGSLDHAKNAIANTGTLKLAFMGDSITEGLDQTDIADAYASRVDRQLKSALPGVAVTSFNFGIGGTGIGTATDANFKQGSGFDRPWGVAGQSWIATVKAFKPDLLVIAFGMNDAGLGPELNYNCYVALLNEIKTWNPVPSMVITTTMLPTKNPARTAQTQMATLMSVRSTRAFAKDNGLYLADANRTFQILRDGLDCMKTASNAEFNWSGYDTPAWSGSKNYFNLSGSTLTPILGTAGKFVARERSAYNFTLEHDVKPANSGIANAEYIIYRQSTEYGDMKLLVVGEAGSNGYVELYTNDSMSGIAIANNLTIPVGSATRIKLVVNENNHKVYVAGTLVLDFNTNKKMHNGIINIGSAGLNPTLSNLTISYQDPLSATPLYSEDDLLGLYDSPQSGNGVNHPSGLGGALIYAPTFDGMSRELSQKINYGMFIPNRLPKSSWGPPGAGYPSVTSTGATLYYQLLNKYDKYKGVLLRNAANGDNYNVSAVAVDVTTLASLEDGKIAYFPSSDTQDFIWISIPGGGGVSFETDLYKYK